MDVLALVLGGLLGFALGLGERWRLKRRLMPFLTSLEDTPQVARSLSLISLVRRELAYLKDRESRLLEERSQSRLILEQAPWGYLQVDEDNHLLWCNRQAQKWLQIDRWESRQYRLLLEWVRSSELDQLVERTRQTQTPHIQEWLFFPPINPETLNPGNLSSWLLKGYSYPLPRGQVAIFIENLQPLAELRRSRDRVFADLTHELRTPLTAISLVAEALFPRLQSPEQGWVGQMLTETERLRALVDEWLSLSQITENPGQCLDLEDLDLRDVLLSSWQRLLPLAQEKQIQLDYQGAEQLWLRGDRDRLIQVFINLFDNCLKHSPERGVITVWADLGASQAQVQVLDQGAGFNPQDLPFIFNRLYRGDPSRHRGQSPRSGSGLGLAIAKEIIEAHQGSLGAANDPQTGGACFTVTLPILSEVV
ncbi:ATP-binding protein [Okeania sp.]|uniref:sensor histidine kinase n=1 Tax=Okeania sp. TaxID=3100323 RepID=UPI002B4AE468|nr:ATP-binding protein [Okeania sp.]MEB3341142.1 ATP-binding protein [Okeania sp.]